ncbi:GDP-mannose 4,6-dehydratase [Leifsonia sp. McL0607]|uniref:GDP-mannose 4,6-dehydratase n=1 Tax=Leifsonia sp. McL0607 TaxID=3415672 RepID=UPI003CF95E62
MSRVVVTGGAGFIGSHVRDRLLERGDEVLVVDNFASGRFEWVDSTAEGHDIRTRDTFGLIRDFRPAAIVHLAAQMSVKVSMRDPVLDADVNVLGLLNVLEAARTMSDTRLAFASSGGTIYGDVPMDRQPIREDEVRRPLSFYGLTKSTAVDYLRLYAAERDVPTVALALGNVYGPRQNPDGEAGVISIFANRLLSDESCIVNGDGKTTRDYVHVSDVADAFVAGAERGSGLINIGTGVATSVNQIYAMTAAAIGSERAPEHGPVLPGEVRGVALDPSRAKEQLGWSPQVRIEDGIQTVVSWLASRRRSEVSR